tara:strand:- start:278 stop:1342 length:1065 start_codon:yes stop_codon:yes gene_type:complete
MKILHFKYRELGPCETFIERQLRLFKASESSKVEFLFIRRNTNQLSCPVNCRSGWLEFLKLFFVLRKNLPNVIHAHFGSNALLAMSLTSIRKLPLIVSFYGHDVGAFPRKNLGFNRILYHYLFKHCHTVVVMTEPMRIQLIDLGCPPLKIKKYYVGVDPLTPRVRKSSSLKNLLMVSSLRPKKNHALVLRSLASLKDKNINLKLRIVGDGPSRNYLEELICQLNIGEQVCLVGHITDRDELAQHYQWADLMLHPSCKDKFGDQEGLPSSIVEAFSAGIAVILSDTVGLRDIFSAVGLYTDPHDEQALVTLISDLYSSPELLKDLEKQSLEIYAKNFAEKEYFEPLQELYMQAIP